MLMIMMHLPRRRSGARLGDGLTPVVWSLAESRVLWDGHACLPCAPVRVIHYDPAASSDMVFWLCVLTAAVSVLSLSYSKLERRL